MAPARPPSSPLPERLVGALVVGLSRLAEHSPIARHLVFRPAVELFRRSAVAAWRRGGPQAWERFHLPAARLAGRGRAAYLARKLALRPESAASLAQVHTYEDPLFGVEGHDEEPSDARAVRRETRCPIGERLRRDGCADFCRVLVHAFETETLASLSPRYRLEPLTELLSAGDARCTFVHHVDP